MSDENQYLVDIHDRVFDAYYGKMGPEFMRQTQSRIHWICSKMVGQHVLDVGCSQGIVSILLARDGVSVVGVDSSSKAIEDAKCYLSAESDCIKDKVTFVNADFLSYSFGDTKFDTVVMAEVLEHLVRPEKFVEVAKNLLTDCGRFIVTVPFGVNDFIDHKHTFYLLQPLKMISKYFEITEIQVIGRWLGIVGTLNLSSTKTANAEIEITEKLLEQLEAAFFENERSLTDEFLIIKKKLDDANLKYRGVTEQNKSFQQKLAQEEAARKNAEQSLLQIDSKAKEIQELLEKERLKLQQETTRFHELDKMLLVRDSEIQVIRIRLDEANAKYRSSTEQVLELKNKLANAMAIHSNAEQNIAQLNAKVREIQASSEMTLAIRDLDIQKEKSNLEKAVAQYKIATEKIEKLQLNLAQSETLRNGAEQNIVELRKDLDREKEKLMLAMQHTRKIESELIHKDQELNSVRIRLDDLGVKYKHSVEQSDGYKLKLEQANLKYRKLTSEEIPKLKEMNAHTKKDLLTTSAKLQEVIKRKVAAESQVLKTRASLSFQLGYILIHACKSFGGFIGLPHALLKLRREATRRKGLKETKSQLLSEVARTQEYFLKETQKSPKEPTFEARENELRENDRTTISLPKVDLERGLRQLKIACIMDEFTFESFRPECNLKQLSPQFWQAEIEEFHPEILFVESAWRGKDDLWGNKVGHASPELQGIIAWCRTKKIPTVFWNKEDPVHFETFLNTAKLFDYVCTTDIDCIHRYKAALGHERVYLMPFACQPLLNNPVEIYERKDAFCFAGAYYVRYPDRTRDLGNFINELSSYKPIEIFDRNLGKNDPNYQFPEIYKPYIVGTLPFGQIDKAYKGYRYSINLNSIKQSQSMFARRVFELLASNTTTVSNFSRGVRLLFGDLVCATDSGGEMVRQLKLLAKDEIHSRKHRLLGLRKVLKEHTYGHRLAYIASKVYQREVNLASPKVIAFGLASSQQDLENLLASCERQTYENVLFNIVLGQDFDPANLSTSLRQNIKLLPIEQVKEKWSTLVQEREYVALLSASDYYGPNYVMDLILATMYSDADIFGKKTFFKFSNENVNIENAGCSYRPADRFALRSSLVRVARVIDRDILQLLESLDFAELNTNSGLAIDEFNYCMDGAYANNRNQVAQVVDDLADLNTGIRISELLERAEKIAPALASDDEGPVLTGKQLAAQFKKATNSSIQFSVENDSWIIKSTLEDGKHEYIYSTKEYDYNEVSLSNQIKYYLDTTPGLNIQIVVVFLDVNKQKISHLIKYPNRNQECEAPLGTTFVRFGLRIYSGGEASVKALVFGHRNVQPAKVIGASEYLVLTNHYPSYDDLYRNAFVHSRVKAYRELGVFCDVFRLRPGEDNSYQEFEGVDVITAGQDALNDLLSSGKYKSVLVHFLDSSMWEVLKNYIHNLKVVVWVHGAEIQPYHRREFNYKTEEERIVAKMKSDARMVFWSTLLKSIPKNLKLVFVSHYFAEEVMEDFGFRLPQDSYTIIHNPINTNLFQYIQKPIEQRKKVLSVRPYASRIYANDLSVQTILTLSKRSWFKNMEFRLIGDGPLFEETLKPLQSFSNVTIEKRFLSQSEIAALHKEYGIFLCPTRMDTQGVSRDEAMASGLVPVTNAVAAVPEFVDDECGILTAGEDVKAMTDGIEKLYNQPELFLKMSKSASERIKKQTCSDSIVQKEVGWFLIRS